MPDPSAVVRAAQQAAGRIIAADFPDDMTAVIIIVPVYRRAILDPRSGWQAEVKAAAAAQIDRSRPPVARIHVIGRDS